MAGRRSDGDQSRYTFWPGWMTAEVEAALKGIDAGRRTKDTAKKWSTVLRLAEGLAHGESMRALLAGPDTCNLATWYGKWSRDPLVGEALRLAQVAATRWKAAAGARALAESRELLQLETVRNVDTMRNAREGLLTLGALAEDDADKVAALKEAARVAGDMLDRAGEETASKQGGSVEVVFRRADRG